MDPLFSIIVPTYNRAYLLYETINFILKQKYDNFELIIIDDGSTDNTNEIIGLFSDKRISYYKIVNSERGFARNHGAKIAKGKYLNFFDSDDEMYENHLIEAYHHIMKNKNSVFFHFLYEIKNKNGELYKLDYSNFKNTSNILPYDNILSCNSVFLLKDIALKFPFSENRLLSSSEDWELWIRLNCRYTLDTINIVTTSIINHDGRSLYNIQVEKIILRDKVLIEKLTNDSTVLASYGNNLKVFIADRYTYFMLLYSVELSFTNLMYWTIQSVLIYPLVIKRKRFWAALLGILYRPIKRRLIK